MGQQINFYFVEQDEKEFLECPPIKKVDILFLKRHSVTLKCEDYGQFHLSACDETHDTQTYICFRTDLPNVLMRKVVSKNNNEIFFFLDAGRSPVIEYIRSGYNRVNNLIVSGRIWFEFKYWDEDEQGNDILLRKSADLLRLYESLARWIRKRCTRQPNGNYIGPHAMELYKKGAKLS